MRYTLDSSPVRHRALLFHILIFLMQIWLMHVLSVFSCFVFVYFKTKPHIFHVFWSRLWMNFGALNATKRVALHTCALSLTTQMQKSLGFFFHLMFFFRHTIASLKGGVRTWDRRIIISTKKISQKPPFHWASKKRDLNIAFCLTFQTIALQAHLKNNGAEKRASAYWLLLSPLSS